VGCPLPAGGGEESAFGACDPARTSILRMPR